VFNDNIYEPTVLRVLTAHSYHTMFISRHILT